MVQGRGRGNAPLYAAAEVDHVTLVQAACDIELHGRCLILREYGERKLSHVGCAALFHRVLHGIFARVLGREHAAEHIDLFTVIQHAHAGSDRIEIRFRARKPAHICGRR